MTRLGPALAVLATAVVLSAVAPVAAKGEGLSNEAIVNLSHRSDVIHMDILQTHQADISDEKIDSLELLCLGALADDAGELSADLGELFDLTVIREDMKSLADARAIDRVRRIRIGVLLKIVSVNRTEINQLLGKCADAPIVLQKGQLLLDFMSEVKDQLDRS